MSTIDPKTGAFKLETVRFADFKSFSDNIGVGSRVLGMPPLYHPSADPAGRVYSKTFLSDLLSVTMVPGKPKFNSVLAGLTGQNKTENDAFKKAAEDAHSSSWVDNLLSGNKMSTTPIDKKASKPTEAQDFRYYAFETDYIRYYQHLQVSLTYLAAQMFGIKFIWDGGADFFKMNQSDIWVGVKYWAEKGTSVSESSTNDMGESTFGQALKAPVGMLREAAFVAGVDVSQLVGASTNSAMAARVQAATQGGTMEYIKKLTSGLTGSGGDNLKTVISGFNVLFPEIWRDSHYSPTYNLEFKFSSPYGDPYSIFRNVYVPFLSLLCMSLPRQESLSGYGAPFILKVDVPGYFSSDMCVVSDIRWSKGGGGQETNWSANGLPTAIDVTVSIKDLYPIMMMAGNVEYLTTNVGMATFLQNMAGVKMYKPNLFADATALLMGNRIISTVMNLGDRLGMVENKGMTDIFDKVYSAATGRSIFN